MAEILEEISLTRVKLLCSYAGRILSRPSDGKLRYVGGETRIIAVNRDITYSELMLKIVELHGQTVALKYQLPDEDLDALVSLCSDEDIENMMDEYAAEGGNSRIRVFLFSSIEHDVEHLSESSGDMRRSNRSILDGCGDLGAVKRSESGASDKMRDLDDMIGLYSDDTQSVSVFEDTAPPPSAPQLLDGVSLLEQFLQLSSAAPLSQSVQIGSSDSVFTSKTLSIQTAAAIFPKEHVGAANCVQSPAHSVSNTTHLASSFSESATLGTSKLSDCENSSDVLTSMTEDHLQHSASATAAKLLNKVHSNLLSSHKFDGMQITKSLGRMNQRDTLAAEQGLPVNLEAYDFTLSNLSKVSISNENASAQPELCLQSHTVEPLQNLESYGIVGYKDLEIEHQNALNSYESLPISKSSDEVVTPEGFDSSCNGITDGAGLDSDQQFYNFRKTNVVGEAQVAAENFLCGGASSDKLLNISGNESLKEQDTKTADVQLKDPILNELSSRASVQRHPSEHVQKTTTIASQMSPLSTTQNVVVFESMHTETTSRTCILQPEMCFSSSLAAEILDLSASLLKNSSDVANKVNTGCFEGNGSQESITEGETVAMSELQQFCETSAPEQIRGRGDIEQQLNAFVNEYVQEEVLLQDNAVNIEVTKDVILEVSTCTSMDIKPDLKPSTFTTVASEAEVEAIARGLQIIRNTDLEERRELGSGTFGTVYHGKWRGSDVAIKRFKSSCFSGSLSEQERLKADFWKEACILAQLRHPNIVAFYGVVPDGTLATVTEFMINGSLKQVLRKKSDRILESRRRLFIAMDSAFGMEYLHSKKIVHFDLKCENLFVNMRDPHRPVCKVGDFGLSKVKQRTLVSGGVRGTLPWMAPELLNGSSNMVSEKVDVFSFGIVMWELLTSEEPYADLHYGAILGGILSDTLRPPVPEGCEPAWRLLMERCWSADPVQRPTFAEIASALRLMAASELVKVQRSNQVTEVAAQEDAS